MPRFYQDELDQELSYERCESFGGGLDAFVRATLIPQDAYQYGLNGLVPDGFEFRTRPGADGLFTAYAKVVQGVFYFDTPSYEQLITGSDQKLYSFNGTTNTEMTGFTLADDSLNFSAAQGVDKMLLADGTSLASWNGTAWTTTYNATDPIKATILLWHANRMWAAGFDGSVAGKENDAIWGSALLAFQPGDWNGTDRNFRIGGGDGDPITALASLSSSADKGYVMAIGRQNSIWLVNTDPTATFTNFTANIGPQQVTDGIGIVGKRACCVDGNDLLFVSPDKTFRSLARMAAAASQYQVGPPLSLPIQPFVKRINWNYAHLICVKKYGELVLFSVPLDSATTPDTIFVWNSRLQRWISIWTGLTVMDMEVTRRSGLHRLVFAEQTGKVRQWKDFEDEQDDDTYLDDTTAIPTKFWSRSFLFQEPLNDKDAFHMETRFGASNAMVTETIVADNAELKTLSEDIRSTGVSLPLSLPFNLVNPQYKPKPRGLRQLKPFNECYIRVESTAGWWSLRTLSMSAFLNTLRTK